MRDDIKALTLTRMVLADGVFVNTAVSPAVPKEDCRISYSLMATLNRQKAEVYHRFS